MGEAASLVLLLTVLAPDGYASSHAPIIKTREKTLETPTKCLWGVAKIEDEVAAKIRTSHARELKVVDAALEQILRGFRDFASRKQRPDNRLERARLFLATRSFNSLRMAVQTVGRGNYQQALTLVRMAMEDGVVANDVENNPPTLAALLDGEGRLSKGDLAYARMAERLSPKAKEVWDDDYGWVSKSAAHPRLESMRGLTTSGPDKQTILRPGGYYDEVEVVNVLYYLLRELVQLMAQITKVTAEAGIDWVTGAMPIFKEVESAWTRLDKWACDRLGESTQSLG